MIRSLGLCWKSFHHFLYQNKKEETLQNRQNVFSRKNTRNKTVKYRAVRKSGKNFRKKAFFFIRRAPWPGRRVSRHVRPGPPVSGFGITTFLRIFFCHDFYWNFFEIFLEAVLILFLKIFVWKCLWKLFRNFFENFLENF